MDTQDRSYVAHDVIVEMFKANPANPFLVSFPRTGSHWLRMLMELYFERPSLVRVFYYPERGDYLTLHVHDLDLSVERSDVIYLYRDPVDTVYSQLNYHKEPLADAEPLHKWAENYGAHMHKWLVAEDFTTHKSIVRYERLKEDLAGEFAKVTGHFGLEVDAERLERAAAAVTKPAVKRKTLHDPQVVQLDTSYEDTRERFRAELGDAVWSTVLEGREGLRDWF